MKKIVSAHYERKHLFLLQINKLSTSCQNCDTQIAVRHTPCNKKALKMNTISLMVLILETMILTNAFTLLRIETEGCISGGGGKAGELSSMS